MKIGILGTGLLGEPVAFKFLEAGFDVSVFNRSTDKTKNLISAGAIGHSESFSLIESNTKIIVLLSDFNAICSVLFHENHKIDYSDKTIYQMSTISQSESLLLNSRLTKLGAKYIECPVLGSIPQVKEGKLIVLFSGDRNEMSDLKKSLAPISNNINYIGNTGKAATLKLALNQMIASLTTIFSMSLGQVLNNDIDPEIFMKILRESALYAPTFDKKLDRMLENNFDNPNFPVKHLLKDVDLARENLEHSGINSQILITVKDILKQSIEMGLGGKDYSALYLAVNNKK